MSHTNYQFYKMESQRSSQDFLTCKPHTYTVNPHAHRTRDTGIAAHRTHATAGRRTCPFRWQDVFLKALAVVCLLHVQSAGATVQEYNCVAGEKLSRFKSCQCGQYAYILPNEDLDKWRSEEIEIFTRVHGPKQIQQSYVCIRCTLCGDGIRIDRQCTQRTDTECSPDECADPTWTFDFGSKSCQPPAPVRLSDTTTVRAPTTTGPPAHTPSPKNDDETEENVQGDRDTVTGPGMRSWLWRNLEAIIIGLVAAVALLLVLIIVIVFLVVQIKGKQQQMALLGSPYSSQNTSKSSVNV